MIYLAAALIGVSVYSLAIVILEERALERDVAAMIAESKEYRKCLSNSG